MKTLAVLLCVGAGVALLTSAALTESGHPFWASVMFYVALAAAPTGVVVFCIAQAAEVILDRIDRRAAEFTKRHSDLTTATPSS